MNYTATNNNNNTNSNNNNNNNSNNLSLNTQNNKNIQQNQTKLNNSPLKFIEVYEDNFVQEIKHLSSYLDEYNYIGMDTEFPGVVYELEQYSDDFYYKSIEKNVNQLKLIQLGLSLFNEKGKSPEILTWQFNFKFDKKIDNYSDESIKLLSNYGMNFDVLKRKGISHKAFAEYFIISGLILNPNIHWISYHGSTDFAYLLKLALNSNLPQDENTFLEKLNLYFPSHYDIKYIIHEKEQYKGGLNKLAQYLDVDRMGGVHQAGSDSLVTGDIFFALKNSNIISKEQLIKSENVLYGLGEGQDNSETINYIPFTKNLKYNINKGYNGYNNYNSTTSSSQTPLNLNMNSTVFLPNNINYTNNQNNNRQNNNNTYNMMNTMIINQNLMGNNMIGYPHNLQFS